MSDTRELAESPGDMRGPVVVISTFRVANGMGGADRQAFLDRPGLADDAPGFLGMEVLVDYRDESIFHLLTRWTDESSFKSWHSGPLHKPGHRGIPKGLKLDPAYTAVRTFYALDGDAGPESVVAEEAPIARLPRFLSRTRSLHWTKASFDGRILAVNPAFALLLQESCETLPGQSLWDRVTQADATSIQAILKSGNIDSEDPVLLNFLNCDHSVQTLKCHIEVRSRDFVLVGEAIPEHDRALAKELLELNNRWALLVRENEKNLKMLDQVNKELEKTLSELNQSHWHLRKIQETLPICLYCGKVKTGETRWEGVAEYLKANSLFLSHGCCPDCLDLMYGHGGPATTGDDR